jgi:hypothetical protein
LHGLWIISGRDDHLRDALGDQEVCEDDGEVGSELGIPVASRRVLI